MIPLVMVIMIWGTVTLTGPSSPFFWGGGSLNGHETVFTKYVPRSALSFPIVG